MSLLDAPDAPREVRSTRAMRVALVACLPVFTCSLGEVALSVLRPAPQLLVATTYLCAMLSWPCLIPILAGTLWASQQEQLAVKSKLTLWGVAALAVLLTWVFPSRVVDAKYYVENRGRGELALGSGEPPAPGCEKGGA